jgi:hydrogenase 3 maturation protease
MQALDLKKILKQNLKGAGKILILGVGSEFRADDIAGRLIAEEIQKNIPQKSKKIKVILGETAPENFTGEIIEFKPSHLIILDAADTNTDAGTINIIEPEQVEGVSFSTHMLPLSIMVDYLKETLKCEVFILGIQPKTVKYGAKPSKEVMTSVKQVADVILSVI